MNKYILKDGTEIEAIPIGKSSLKIGEENSRHTLTICDRAPNGQFASRGARVICKCICGQYTVISLNSFRAGTTYSCGCLASKVFEENGRRIGKMSNYKDYTKIDNPFYTFIKQLDEKDSCNSNYWIIECKKCHSRYKAVPAQLISNKRSRGINPCQCYQHISKGVLKIEQILQENNIQYKKEVFFDDCLSPKGNQLRFDFQINNDYLIEFDGEQHFLPECFNLNVDGEKKLKIQQEYDMIKNIWCKENNITLIRIPYTQYQNLSLQDLLKDTSTFIQR